ncbi:MAG: TonB-dependent receptor [Ignavibacteria bacterium]|nr:TonB-dependent receptor [Ignavibacteria bacterium]
MSKNFFTFLIFALISGSALSQEYRDTSYIIPEIEVISFFNNVNELNSPSNSTSLRGKEIEKINGRNAGDVLQTIPGIFVKNYGSGGSLQTISMNGLNAEHTVVLLNGSKLNSIQNSQFDLSLITKTNLKSVEVLTNGFSSVYGSDAIGGVVNIVTEDLPIPEKLNLKLNSSYGSYNTRNIGFSAGNKIKNFLWSIDFSDERSDNDFNYYYSNGTTRDLKARINSKYSVGNYVVSGLYNPSGSLSFKFYTQFVNSKKDLPGPETGTPQLLSNQKDRNWNNILSINYSGKSFSLSNEVNFQNNLMNYELIPFTLSYYRNLLVSNLTRFNFNFKKHTSVIGAEAKYAAVNSNELESNANRKQYSVFSSNTLNFGKIKLFPSLRYDRITDISDDVLTYKIGINYKPFESYNLHLRGNYSNNYSAPAFNALYWKTGGSRNLKPEKSRNIELGLITSGNLPVNYILSFTYLNINADNRIIWLPGNNYIWSPVNILESESDIFISSIRMKFNLSRDADLNAELSYTHNNSVKKSADFENDLSEGKQIVYIPSEQIKSNLEFRYKSFGINIFYSHIGKRFSDAENLTAISPSSVLDGNVYYEFKIRNFKTRLKMEINNITDTDYQYIPGYPMPLRNFLMSIQIDYSL